MSYQNKNLKGNDLATAFFMIVVAALILGIHSLILLPAKVVSWETGVDWYLAFSVLSNPIYMLMVIEFPVFYAIRVFFPRWIFLILFYPFQGAFFVYIIVDRLVYQQFKFHINGFALKILRQPDAMEVLGIRMKDVLTGVIFLAFSIALSFLAGWLIQKSPLPRMMSSLLKNKRRKLLFVALFLSIFFLDKTVYTWLKFQKNIKTVILSDTVPFYLPPSANRFYVEVMGFERPVDKNPTIDLAKTSIKYPLEPLSLGSGDSSKLPNIILLMSDAVRYDMINPENMPHTYRFVKKHGIHFKRHFSGSNGTTNGLFSLFYGLPASYKMPFSYSETSPVFIDSLIANKYKVDILGSAKLGWFATDKIIFFKVMDRVQSGFHKSVIESDYITIDKTLRIIDENLKQPENPFFLMSFLDGTHISHFRDKEFKKFTPDNTSSFFNPANKKDREAGNNQYYNSVYFADAQFKKVLDKVEQSGLLENTILIITSDHGSERFEHGHWGHASAFTNEQLLVPFSISVPGMKSGEVRRYTSHVDIVPTLLDMMGENLDNHLYTTGTHLFNPEKRDFLVASGESNVVLIDKNYKINYFPHSVVPYYEVTDGQDNPVPDSDKVLRQYTPQILKMFQDLGKFLQ